MNIESKPCDKNVNRNIIFFNDRPVGSVERNTFPIVVRNLLGEIAVLPLETQVLEWLRSQFKAAQPLYYVPQASGVS